MDLVLIKILFVNEVGGNKTGYRFCRQPEEKDFLLFFNKRRIEVLSLNLQLC